MRVSLEFQFFGACSFHLGRATYVPGEEDEHGANGEFADEPLEALLSLAIRILENVIADLQEVLASLDGCGNLLGSVGNRAAHLGGQLQGQLIDVVSEPLQRLLDDGLPICE